MSKPKPTRKPRPKQKTPERLLAEKIAADLFTPKKNRKAEFIILRESDGYGDYFDSGMMLEESVANCIEKHLAGRLK